MIMKIKEHKWAVLLTGLVGFLAFYYYAVIHPTLLLNGDDWGYFGLFSGRPMPFPGAWNATRLFPEYLMPITGYLSSFFLYPLTGDYLMSANIALAIMMGIAIASLFLAFYIFLNTLHENKAVCAAVSVMMIALCFTIFKSLPAENIHMFDGGEYNIYFFYILPNIFNSIIVLMLMRHTVLNGRLSVKDYMNNTSIRRGLIIVAIYFGIFSMLFSAAILLAFALSVIIYRFFISFRLKKTLGSRIGKWMEDSFKQHNIAIIIIAGMIIAMVLEITSDRSNSLDFGNTYFGLLFSGAFLQRIGESASNFLIYIRSFNKYILLFMICIVAVSCVLYWRDRSCKREGLSLCVMNCLISTGILFFFYTLLGAKAGPKYITEIRCTYGLFFFVILLVGIAAIYILKKISFAKIFLPIVISIIIMFMLNSLWPYRKGNWTYEQEALMNSQIQTLVQADRQGHTSIELYVPNHYTNPLWVVKDKIAVALYNHKITKNKIIVTHLKYSADDSMYYLPNEVYD